MGSDETFEIYWSDYYDFEEELVSDIVYKVGFPIFLILFADALYIQLRQGVKRRNKRKRRRRKKGKDGKDRSNSRPGSKGKGDGKGKGDSS